jgi:hypothetical protein
MRRFLIFITINFLLSSINVVGQTAQVYDSKDEYYEKTNFSIVDTIENWVFNIDTSYHGTQRDSVKPIGAITFLRKTTLFDKKYFESNKKNWRPYLSFEVFLLKDSAFCLADSKNTRNFSSCLPPFTGGDILFIGDFILLNRRVCNAFSIKWENEIDYARPVINKVFSHTNIRNLHSFQDFIKELPIEGKLL